MSSSQRPSNVRSRPSGSRVSRLPVRDSSHAIRGRSLDKRSTDHNLIRSKSTLCEPLRFSRQRSTSSSRCETPLAQIGLRSIGKSPTLSVGSIDSRPISDKKWQFEQLSKVKSFIARHEPLIDHNMIKPGMPIDMFIALTAALFKRIDKRIEINRGNYVETVPSRLRLLAYPTSVKPSLMKAVNIPHSWPSVLAILTWLTDVITEINGDCELTTNALQDAALKYFKEMYNIWNTMDESSDKMKQPLRDLEISAGKYFGNDLEKLTQLENRCRILKASIMDYSEIIKRKEAENKALRERCQSVKDKCNAFAIATEGYELEIVEKKTAMNKKCEKLDKELEGLVLMEKELKDVISSQPYSIVEQRQLISDIEDLKNVIPLQEERCQQQKTQVHAFDHQLSDLNQKIQASAFNYNNIIREMLITHPSFKQVLIRESGFTKDDANQIYEKALEKLTAYVPEMKEQLNVKQSTLKDLNQKRNKLEEELVVIRHELEDCTKVEAEIELEMQHQNTKFVSENRLRIDHLNKLQEQLLKLKENRPNIEFTKTKLLQTQQECDLGEKQILELQQKALTFFAKLDLQISNNIYNYTKIMENISNSVVNMQENGLKAMETGIEFIQKVDEEIKEIKSNK